jgi:hypothetical protein
VYAIISRPAHLEGIELDALPHHAKLGDSHQKPTLSVVYMSLEARGSPGCSYGHSLHPYWGRMLFPEDKRLVFTSFICSFMSFRYLIP